MRTFTNYFLLAAIVLFSGCGKKNKTARAQYKDLTETVYASGNIFPVHEYKAASNVDGFLTGIFVTEGDSVKEGQLLFSISSEMQDVKAKSTSEIYKIASENAGNNSPVLNEAEAQKNSSQAKMQNDSLNYARMKNLFESKSVSQNDFEKAKLNYQVSSNDYKAKKNFYEKLKNQVDIDLRNAEMQMKLSGTDIDNYRLKSYQNGKVFEIYKKKGDNVRRNEAIALIGDVNKVFMKLSVDEADIARILVGQEVVVKIDITGNKIYKAKVTKVYPKLNKEEQSFRVDAEFTEALPTGYYGLTVEANIIVSRKNKVLTVPKTAMLKSDSLEIVSGGEKKRIKVTTGVEDFERVEILDGLKENDEVIIK